GSRGNESRHRHVDGSRCGLPAPRGAGRRVTMFSPALEVVLTIAYREALSRRHAYVTLEHLLYALAHDADGERILGACGVDLPRLRRDLDAFLHDSIERVKRGQEPQPEQTAAFSLALPTPGLPRQSSQAADV